MGGRSRHLGSSSFQPPVIVGDDQAGAAQAAMGEGSQELVLEDLSLTGLDRDTQDLTATI
ncbi:hypothetical protein DKT77_13350 [Meridianimarinicoccus roseus]|uniref:Uncharacterized protein n=1 Tax=Meridianimarinicoccus roseus TaxID=2072018 RepID=A0A2V2LF53_9RHOB|nr:hypothetical protein DKT77_13350 [Meridianimarinicoccus roseus]